MKCCYCELDIKVEAEARECPLCRGNLKAEKTRERFAAACLSARKGPGSAGELRALAAEGCYPAMTRLGRVCLQGGGLFRRDKNVEEAVKWLSSSARGGSVEGAYHYANLLSEGARNFAPKSEEALFWLTYAAHRGYPTACLRLGERLQGSTNKQDAQRAAYWFWQGACAGSRHAALRLAECYREGAGVPCDSTKATALRALPAEGLAQAVTDMEVGVEHPCLGEDLYRLSLDACRYDLAAIAFSLCQKSAEMNYPSALRLLSRFYRTGYGVETSTEKAFDALRRLGDMLETGVISDPYVGNSEEDPEDVYSLLSDCYLQGYGTLIDAEQAVKCLEAAGELGAGKALYRLGELYEEGVHVKQNNALACHWFNLAVKAGYSRAFGKANAYYTELTKICRRAEKCALEGDNAKALELYLEAVAYGSRASYCRAAYLLLTGAGGTPDARRAFGLYKEAADLFKDREAMVNVGILYMYGRGVNRNYRLALQYLRRAQSLGSDKVAEPLEILHRRRMKKLARRLNSAATVVFRRGEFEKAFKMRYAAMEAGNANAAYLMGCQLRYGDGIEQDEATAQQWFDYADQLGFKRSVRHMIDDYVYARKNAGWL